MYLYNMETGVLHLEGCQHLKPLPYNYKAFETESDAQQFAGRAGKHIRMCKTCQKRRDKMLKGEK